jgi:DNA replication protein DnaC
MLAHPTLERLHTLGLHGLAKGFKEIEHNAEARGLDHAEWLGLLLEYETTLRRQKQFEMRAKAARLRHHASVEDVNYHIPRGLDRALFLKLAACDWIAERRHLLITGAALRANNDETRTCREFTLEGQGLSIRWLCPFYLMKRFLPHLAP